MNLFFKLIISVFLFAGALHAAVPNRIDSILQVISELPPDTTRLKTLKYWSRQLAATPHERALLETLRKEAQIQNNPSYQAYAYYGLLKYYYNFNYQDSLRLLAKTALHFLKKNDLHQYYFNARYLLVTLHTDLGEYEFSLLKGEEMYREAVAISNRDGEIAACNALAHANFASHKYHDAIYWNRKGLRLVEGKEGYLSTEMNFNYVMAQSYQRLQQPDSMKRYTDQVRQVINHYEKKYPGMAPNIIAYYYAWIYSRYADYELYRNDLQKAKSYLDRAASFQEKNTFDLYSYFSTYADYYRATGQYDAAFRSLEKEAALREKNNKPDPSLLTKRALIYARMGNDTLALSEIQKSIQLADSLNRKRFSEQSDQLRSIYEINRLETEGKKQTDIIRMQILTLTGLLFFVVLLAFYLIKFYRIRKQLALAAREADEANSATSGFLQNMQRGIQAFLQDIARVSDLLIEESDPQKRAGYAERLRAQNEIAQHVIFNILDVSKIESGQMKFHLEEIDLQGPVHEAVGAIRHIVPHGTEIKINAPGGILIRTDLMRLHQILTNVLRYAVSRTSGKQIRIAYKKQAGEVRFSLSGDGWRLSEKEQQTMFDRLAQTSGKLQDMDLDMIISRGLILKLGGRIEIHTGTASRIEFTFPLSPTLQNERT